MPMTTRNELLCEGCDGTGVMVGHGQDDREYWGRCHWCEGTGAQPKAGDRHDYPARETRRAPRVAVMPVEDVPW